ncbi:DUF4232 domain-containing protein [Actinoplanes sp. NPDC048988]|uniref:DUF4232 domain-containing protein n=1 Tax=Actinoplanes sp. NPDC048988 TaxID=3363901 RepID=UPI0037155C7F
MARRANHLILAAVASVAVLALPACSTGQQPSTPIPPAAGGASPASGEPAPATSRPAPRTTTADALRACRDDDVATVVTYQPDRADGWAWGLVSLTNKSTGPCQVDGHAGVSLVNAAGEVVKVPARTVDQPGPAMPVTLRPGGAAFEGLRWRPCDKGDPYCGAGNTLRLSLQAETDGPVAELDGFPAPESSGITMKSLEIGTLQPSRQGVVAW